VVVTSHYVDEIRDFPVNLSPYVPADEFEEGENSSDFSTKIQLGKKLALDALEKGIQFREIFFDNWYLCHNFVSFIRGKRKDWISTLNLKSDDVIYLSCKQETSNTEKEEAPNKEKGKGIHCGKFSQFPPTELFSGNDKGLQKRRGGTKIYLGSKF